MPTSRTKQSSIVVAVLALAVVGGTVLGFALAGNGSGPQPSSIAGPGGPGSPAPSASPAAPTPTPEPTPTPHADAGPDADAHAVADAHADTRAGAADRAHGPAGHRRSEGHRGHDRRPPGRPAAVRLQQRVRGLARSGRGRRPALHAVVPGPGAGGCRAGAQCPLLLHRLGRRVERGLWARRRLAPGAPDAARQGQRRAGLQRRRVPLGRHLLLADDRSFRAAQRVHRRQGPAADGQAHRRRGRGRPGAGLDLPQGPQRPPAAGGHEDHRRSTRTTRSPTSTTGSAIPTRARSAARASSTTGARGSGSRHGTWS